MKKLKYIFSPRRLIVWMVILLLALTVPELTKPAMSQTEAIVTLMCLDKVEDEIVASVSVLTPAQEKTACYEYFSGSGGSLSQAMDKLSLTIGKEMGFSQCEIIAFGLGLCDHGVFEVLDYMTRTKKISRNAMLISFDGDIDDVSKALEGLSDNKKLKIENIMNFDKKYSLSAESDIDSFYQGYFTFPAIGVMPQIKVTDNESVNAIAVQAGGNANQQSQTENKKLYLTNDGTVTVFKKGKRLFEIDERRVREINLFTNKKYKGTIMVEGVTDEIFDDAKIIFNVTKSQSKAKVSFENGKPKYKVDLVLTVYIDQVEQDEVPKSFLRRTKDFMTETALNALKEMVKSNIDELISFCKTNDVDLLNVYSKFYKKAYKDFSTTIMEKEKYLDDIEFDVSVKVLSTF